MVDVLCLLVCEAVDCWVLMETDGVGCLWNPCMLWMHGVFGDENALKRWDLTVGKS